MLPFQMCSLLIPYTPIQSEIRAFELSADNKSDGPSLLFSSEDVPSTFLTAVFLDRVPMSFLLCTMTR